jgi:hypothetical protein
MAFQILTIYLVDLADRWSIPALKLLAITIEHKLSVWATLNVDAELCVWPDFTEEEWSTGQSYPPGKMHRLCHADVERLGKEIKHTTSQNPLSATIDIVSADYGGTYHDLPTRIALDSAVPIRLLDLQFTQKEVIWLVEHDYPDKLKTTETKEDNTDYWSEEKALVWLGCIHLLSKDKLENLEGNSVTRNKMAKGIVKLLRHYYGQDVLNGKKVEIPESQSIDRDIGTTLNKIRHSYYELCKQDSATQGSAGEVRDRARLEIMEGCFAQIWTAHKEKKVKALKNKPGKRRRKCVPRYEDLIKSHLCSHILMAHPNTPDCTNKSPSRSADQ